MSKNEKRIIFLTPQLPFPPTSGGTIKSYKLIEYLSENYNLFLISLLKSNDEIENSSFFISRFEKNLLGYKFFPIPEHSYKRNVKNLLKSYIKRIPLTVYRNYIPDVTKFIANLLEHEKFNVIFVDHYIIFHMIINLHNLIRDKKIKILLHEHNAEYILWERYSATEKNILKKILTKIEAVRIRRYEKYICELSDKILCVSSNDIENLKKLGIQNNKIDLIMSVGDDNLLNKPDLNFNECENSILFIGTLSWEANLDGLIWFLEQGWNILKNKIPDVKFYIVGKNPPDKLLKVVKRDKDVILTGFVEDLEEYYRKSKVFISPLRFGSGIKIKNINAMYRGIPLVTTSIGIEGINGMDGIHFMVADDINNFIDKIHALMTRKELWEKISYAARRLMREEYTWEKSLSKLKEIIDQC
ncbi:MAG: glycosyl transferase [Candidatus Sericytochromatia bacterium]|nr:MAG: glycosyl transferase [Candidatus Sericytochromatia bacterium]GIX42976.1 MAG: glycosyl transferase [Leptospiraceae bacterium]